MIHSIRSIPGGSSSTLELVEYLGRTLVRKTSDLNDITNERAFTALLAEHGLPHLELVDAPELAPNQLLLEYVEGSTTMQRVCTPELCRGWGAIMRSVHAIRADGPSALTAEGMKPIVWSEFLRSEIQRGRGRNQREAPDLDTDAVAAKLEALPMSATGVWSIVHGDPHRKNVLVRSGLLVLFGKGVRVFAGDVLYDLALVCMEFPAGLFYAGTPSEAARDTRYLRAFFEGYGRDVLKEEPLLRDYVLFRSLVRHPNPHHPQLRAILDGIMQS